MPDTGKKEPANYQLKVGHLEKSENSKLYHPHPRRPCPLHGTVAFLALKMLSVIKLEPHEKEPGMIKSPYSKQKTQGKLTYPTKGRK